MRQLCGATLELRKKQVDAIMDALKAAKDNAPMLPPETSQLVIIPDTAHNKSQLEQEGSVYALSCATQDKSAGNVVFCRLVSCIELAMWLCRASQEYGIQYPVTQAYN
ncbi:hypothetical protein FRC07_000425 [Ceratobasidium sp. 392]|nr:hypothetical protein FRC07_000425 [Ceratobasidium sp. 392]